MKEWGLSLKNEGFLRHERDVKAFNSVDRADFLTEEYRRYSSIDEPLPIPFNKVQSAPHMDAIFVDKGKVSDADRVLEIGTGSGYLTTILSLLCKRVVSAEIDFRLLRWASANISRYGRKNIDLICGNINSLRFKEKFDLIVSTASFRKEPAFLAEMVKEGGRIIYPLGESPPQRLFLVENGIRKEIGWVAFIGLES